MNSRSNLMVVTAALEASAGLIFLIVPALVIWLLLGIEEALPETLLMVRIGGAALLTMGIMCWGARKDHGSEALGGVVSGMMFYNTAAVVLLAMTGATASSVGFALWPAVALHVGMAVWCLLELGAISRSPVTQ